MQIWSRLVVTASNQDLPYCLKRKLLLTPYVRTIVWGGDEKHYQIFPLFSRCRSRVNQTALRRFAEARLEPGLIPLISGESHVTHH
jgi:hypothetical protein